MIGRDPRLSYQLLASEIERLSPEEQRSIAEYAIQYLPSMKDVLK